MPEMLKDPNPGLPFPVLALCLTFVVPLPVLMYWLFEYVIHERKQVVEEGFDDLIDDDEAEASGGFENAASASEYSIASDVVDKGINVLFASLEHAVPGLDKARAVAGGLGKVVDLISRHHPGDIIMVHPMVKPEDGKVSYKSTEYKVKEDPPLILTVDNERETVKVYRHTMQGEDSCTMDFLLLWHPSFVIRTKEAIYPNPMTRRGVLRFFSLWNQAVGALLVRHRPHVYHCPDFHTAVAPWYAIDEHPALRVVLTLHNAEYQGGISTDMIRAEKLPIMAGIWNLPEPAVKKHLVYQGRFNMLKAIVNFIQERQDGHGICAVSTQYAREVTSTYSIFWTIPSIIGLENPMLEEERTQLVDSLEVTKANAKREIQELCELNQDPDARLFVSLGRLVRQKGVDLLADITPWLLETHPNAQLMVVGPVADGFGCYAQEKLEAVAKRPEFKGRLFIKCEFWKAPPALKLATDFCLMPSRDEPFGYVDIEFAWCGAVMVGAKAGGLGKVPGFYYKAQNRDNLKRLKRELCTVIGDAMHASKEQLAKMGDAGLKCSFPLKVWKKSTVAFYESVLPQSILRDLKEKHHGGVRRSLVAGATSLKPSSVLPTMPPMVDVAVGDQKSFFAMPRKDEYEEFLTQELSEEELSSRVGQKIAEYPEKTIEEVLKSVGADVNQERENDNISKWLLGESMGEPRIHWLVCIGYVSSFASSLLTSVIAIRWGFKSSKFGQDKLFVITFSFGDVIIPTSWMPLLVCTVDAIAFVVGSPIWAKLCFHVEPRRLLSMNLLLKPLLVLVIAPFQPNAIFALVLVFLSGLINSGGLLFTAFNFMMTIEADMSRVALRIGMLEMIRYGVTWGLSAYVFMSTPKPSTKGWEASWSLFPIGVIVIICTVVPGVLILSAPGPYRDDRCPGWDMALFFKKKSFLFLCLSELVGDIAKFPSGMFMSWTLTNHWKTSQLGVFCLVFLGVFSVCTGFWSIALSKASVHGMSFLLGVVLLLAPPTMLRAVVLEEVSTYSYYGRSEWALTICAISLMLEGIRTSCIWSAQIRILNSRWRLLTYGTVFYIVSHMCLALSPWFNEWVLAQRSGASFITTSQKQLADAVVVCLIPLSIVQFFLQLCAMPFIRHDLGIPGGGSKKQRRKNARIWRFRQPIGYVIWALVALSLSIAFFRSYANVNKPMEYQQVNNCHVESRDEVPSSCKTLVTECKSRYGLNRYHQNTTARTKCLERMVEKNGNSFVLTKGCCKILKCSEKAMAGFYGKRYVRNALDGYELWSLHCAMSGQNLITVRLFEWTWTDVMYECENYLGPAGFDAVGVSPPLEHTLGDSWYVRYQPVSYKFNSRSGTEEEFIEMVRRCTAAGVNVMADVVINHMAGPWVQNPYIYAGQECGPETVACEGWGGTAYASRLFPNGEAGLDNYTRAHFHHYPNDELSNCGCPPWLNNQVVCDFEGQPDLDTEGREVRQMIGALLRKLYDIGVTMIRVDAARHIFPESQAFIYAHIPWEFIVIEVYEAVAYTNQATWSKLLQLGNMYDTAYSKMLTEHFVDIQDDKGKWQCKTPEKEFHIFSRFGSRLPDCKTQMCQTPVPESRSMTYVDNHDSQRWRFRKPYAPPYPPMCNWDVRRNLLDCVLNFKYGAQYHLMQMYLLFHPYGDSIRLMSSFAFFEFRQGPPGVRFDSLHEETQKVYRVDSKDASGCRRMPETSPVTPGWDDDQEHPWICEHRWTGMSGMVQFRKLVMQDRDNNVVNKRWSDGQGRLSYSLGEVGFVALSRGWNWFSGCGSNDSYDLSGRAGRSRMPTGTYCNLARQDGIVPAPVHWSPEMCNSDTVTIDDEGQISRGKLSAGSAVVLHKRYKASREVFPEPLAEPDFTPSSNTRNWWGWKSVDKDGKDPQGCCYALHMTVYGSPTMAWTAQTTSKECDKRKDGSEGSDKLEINWNNVRCPKNAEEGLLWIVWSRENNNETHTELEEEKNWVSTAWVFVCIIAGEILVCTAVLMCKTPALLQKLDGQEDYTGASAVEMADVLLENASPPPRFSTRNVVAAQT